MAPRWRIRHKLLLGVCLVCGALALLLAGTLRGLWSYYLTMNSIRSKQAELKVAKEFSKRCTISTIFKSLAASGRRTNFFDCFRGLPDKARQSARGRSWTNTRTQLQETLSQGRDPSNGEHQLLRRRGAEKGLRQPRRRRRGRATSRSWTRRRQGDVAADVAREGRRRRSNALVRDAERPVHQDQRRHRPATSTNRANIIR